ncbi:T9SS type A sorting domain-containing protein [Flavobacterium sp. NKUCC04_CG]|uniref:Ig-like domain-containing protein n=1 Tax=Flavobacterium sp. NKUCC04_CG TaxID=2842121 RepID=UPI001C5B4D83|nr:T9SS type A sorting domain-containing protein [Flavobacterium sp. NKUCC04_CG]MBW3517698.1 T9SS type A sorting domain-containing protein [Flavobacterium sp. NKUCC04_CG]
MEKKYMYFLTVLLLLFSHDVTAQTYTRLGIVSGFNSDVIANGVGPASGSTTVRIDNDRFNLLSLDFKSSVNSPPATVGLPVNGLITANNITGLSFQLQPYSQNNSLRIASANQSGTLVISDSPRVTTLYLLALSGNAGDIPTVFQAKVYFTDNTSQLISGLQVVDWFENLVGSTVTSGFGRVSVTDNNIETPEDNPKMFSVAINLDSTNYNKAIRSIEITKTSSAAGVINIFAVSAISMDSCSPPNNVAARDISANSFQIHWDAAFSTPDLGYEYEVRTSGEPGSGTLGLVDFGMLSNDVFLKAISELTTNTLYYVYLRSKCDAESFSPWISVEGFRTLCATPSVVVADAAICGSGSVSLEASANEGILRWYDRAIGGSFLQEGNSFVTPVLTETTSYWVSQSIGTNPLHGAGGKDRPFLDSAAFALTNWGIIFDSTQEVNLESVDLYSDAVGVVDIKIVDSNGNELFSTGNIEITNTGRQVPNTVPLGFTVPEGAGYRILLKSSAGLNIYRDMIRNQNYFPLVSSSGVLTVRGSDTGSFNTNVYMYFFNIKYQTGCVVPRKEVVVSVNAAPDFELSANRISGCAGELSDTITIVRGMDVFDSYEWSPSTGVSGNAQDGWLFEITTNQIYTLTAKQTGGQQCTVFKNVWIQPIPTPNVTYIPETDGETVCLTSIIPLETVTTPVENTIQVGHQVPTNFSADLSAFNNYRNNARVQLLFTAEELRSLGLSSGPLNSIAFFVSSLGVNDSNADYTVKIAPTNLTKFENRHFLTDNFRTVYSRGVHIHTASGWQEINFHEAFVWDGVQNLIIELTHRGVNGSSSADTHYTVTTENKVLYGYNNANIALSKNRFNIKLKQVYSYHVEWDAREGELFIDAEASIPYLPNRNARRVYYRPEVVGLNSVWTYSKVGNCVVSKLINIHTFVTPQPAVEATQSFCGVARVADLQVDGEDIRWYKQINDASPLLDNDILEAGDYYVTQNLDGCESIPKKCTVNLLLQPAQPTWTPRIYCGTTYINDVMMEYDPTNELKWYNENGSLITTNMVLRSGTYYIAQSNADCESEWATLHIQVNAIPAVPMTRPLIFCERTLVSDLGIYALPGASIKCYANETDINELSSASFLTTHTYYLSQVLNGCESERIAVPISVFARVPEPQVQNQNFCTTAVRVADLEVEALEGATVNWYNSQEGSAALPVNQVLTTGLYYVSQKMGDCESSRVRFGVNIVENSIAPTVALQTFCGTTTVSQLRVNLPNGMLPKWYLQAEGGEALSNEVLLQSGWYYISQSLHGCESPRTRVEVVINEIPEPPTGNAFQQFEEGSLIGDLVVDQENVVWFGTLPDALNNRNRLQADYPLFDNTIYYGVVISESGCLSSVFQVKVQLTLGMNTFDLKQLKYYPNPVSDILSIGYKDLIIKIEVYSVRGQRVFVSHTSSFNVDVDMSNLEKAPYFIKIYTASQQQTIKVFKK